MTDRPWEAIPPSLAQALRPSVADLVEATLAKIAEELPDLGGDLAGAYGHALRRGIDQALNHFLDLLGTAESALDPRLHGLYESFGAREDRHGRTLETLLAAYRLGARSAWSHFAAVAAAAGTPTDQLVPLAEAIFVYIDELSSASTIGFSHAHAARVGQRDVLRQQLAQALIDGEAATDAARVHNLCAAADWAEPDALAVAILPRDGVGHQVRVPPPGVLIAAHDAELVAVIPGAAPGAQIAALASAAGANAEVYVGTVRPPAQAPVSLAHARAAQRLAKDGVIPRGRVVSAAEHLPELLLHADPVLLADLARQALAPLEQISPPRRTTAARTLRSWLAHHGDRAATARDLGVHPQTVSYRMAQLEDLFGDALRSPRERFVLAVALQAVPGTLADAPEAV